MAKGKKTGGVNFKKGQSGNPKGRPRSLPGIELKKKINKDILSDIFNRHLNSTISDLQKVLRKPDTSAIEIAIAKIIVEAIKRGDEKRMDFLLNRTVGNVKREYELTGKDGGPIEHARSMTDEDREARIEFLLSQRKGEKGKK